MSFATQFFAGRDHKQTLAVAPYPRHDPVRAHRFAEFVSLTEAAELDPVGVDSIDVRDPHPGTFFRSGAIERLKAHIEQLEIDVVAVDHDLTPIQQTKLERALDVGVLDRTAIILTIFGRRATSREGKLQIELAQAEYVLPRLVGLWGHLHRERGGIGVRGGAGEKQIELDRRMLRAHIARIKRELKDVERTRELHRAQRRRADMAHVAIVGYTNVGKSSLLSALSGGSIFVRDMPFATLDPRTRRVAAPDGTRFLLTDTVGFVQDLPHGLVEAFKSTLEEAAEADLIIHVIDAAAPEPRKQVETTEAVLAEIGGRDRPTLYVLNKIDQARWIDDVARELEDFQPQLRASVLTGEGLEDIVAWIVSASRSLTRQVRIRIPLDQPEAIQAAERGALRPGRWGTEAVEYDVPADSDLAREWAC